MLSTEVWDFVKNTETSRKIEQAVNRLCKYNHEDIAQDVRLSLYLRFIDKPIKFKQCQEKEWLFRKVIEDFVKDSIRKHDKINKHETPSSNPLGVTE